MPLTLRLGLFYAAIFVGTGASLPYIPVWFRAQGLSGAQIGLILAAPMMVRIFISPLLAIWADGFDLRRTPLSLLGFASAVAFALMGTIHGFWACLVFWLIGACLLGTIAPLGDVMSLRLARREGFAYAWPRGIGSLAFVVGNIGVGALLTTMKPELVVFWTVGAAVLAGFAALGLPREPVHEGGERPPRSSRLRGLSELMSNRAFLLAIAGSGTIQATHAFYYGFSALLWRRQEIGEIYIGILWGLGVLVEIAFLWFGEPLRRRIKPETMVFIGGIAALIRWTALAFSPPLWMLFPLQALHALSFMASFLGSLALIERYAPPHAASAAQTISSACAGGLFIGLATLASGPLFDAFGALGYLGMTIMTLGGLIATGMLMRRP